MLCCHLVEESSRHHDVKRRANELLAEGASHNVRSDRLQCPQTGGSRQYKGRFFFQKTCVIFTCFVICEQSWKFGF